VRIGGLFDSSAPLEEATAEVRRLAEAGFPSAWAPQIFGHDTLTLLALVGREVGGIELGTAVVPIHPRHPSVLAQQAATVQSALGGRLALGIGLSHQLVVERMWGLDFTRPAGYMREYLSALVPMLAGQAVNVEGEQLRAVSGPIPQATVPTPVYVAALGPVMLKIAGELADGTVTWMTGIKTIGDHIAPKIRAAAEAAGRPSPRVVVGLPICVTADEEKAAARIDEALAIYPNLPSYRAMLDLEGVQSASGVALVGHEEEVTDAVGRLAEAGATDLTASVMGDPEERERTWSLLARLSAG
jgi:5,10-methylenetetrahydromethanopterin reductase